MDRDGKPKPTCSNRDKADQFILAHNRRFVRRPEAALDTTAEPKTPAALSAEARRQRVLHFYRDLDQEPNGYDKAQVRAGLEALADRISDPNHGFDMTPPFFDRARKRDDGYRVAQIDRFVLSERPRPSTFLHALRLLLAEKNRLHALDQIPHPDLEMTLKTCGVPDSEPTLAVIDLGHNSEIDGWNLLSRSFRQEFEKGMSRSSRRSHRQWMKSNINWHRAVFTSKGLYLHMDPEMIAVPYEDIKKLIVSWTTSVTSAASDQGELPSESRELKIRYGSQSIRPHQSGGLLASLIEAIQKLRIDY